MKTKNKKTIGSKIMALCLAVVMMMAMSVTAFATISQGEKGSITVDNIEPGATVSIYKVIDVNFDFDTQQPVDPVYTWNDSVKASDVATDYAEPETALKNDNIATVVDSLANYVKTKQVTAIGDPVEAETASVTIDELDMGAYLILIQGAEKIYSPGFVTIYPQYADGAWSLHNGSVSVDAKATTPSIDKEITGPSADSTVAIGDTVNYELTITIPQYPENAIDKYFAFSDTLSEGLTYNNDLKITGKTGVSITVADYFTDATAGSNTTFKYVANQDKYGEFAALAGDTIHVTYSATVNENAYTNKDDLTNTASLEYSRNPYVENDHNIKDDEEQVYTYALNVLKLGDNNAKLAGAEFVLKEDNTAINVIKESDGIYRVAKTNEGGATTTLVSSAEGNILIKGLDEGTYTLTETKAPGGYTLPADPDVTIVLSDKEGGNPDGADGTLDNSSATGAIIDGEPTVDGSDLNVTIRNTTSDFNLPSTGGMGTMIFTVAGILLMGGAAVLVVVALKRRKAAE